MHTIERAKAGRRPVVRGRGSRRRWSRRTRILVGLGVLLVLVWVAFAALQLAKARQEAVTGINGLESLRASMTVESVNRGSDLAGLRQANAHFRAANNRTRSPALAPLRILPVVGRQIRSVDALTAAASDVTTIAEARLSEARALLASAHVDAPERVTFVRNIGRLGQDTDTDLAGVHLGPANGLVGPLAHARDRFVNELGSLRTSAAHVSQGSAAVAQLLQGPRNYLLLAANNSEMRVGSGAFLSVGVLSTADGSLHLGPVRSVVDFNLPDARVPLTGDLADRWGWLEPNREWRNLASSPRFDANAQLATQMWKASTGQDVDGVMAIDIEALRALLAATGPVVVDGNQIDAANVVNDVMLQQYARLAPNHDEAQRREELSLIASAVVDKLQNGNWDPERLASELVDVASGRHLMLWSAHPDEQAGWTAVQVAGTLKPNSMLLGLHNRGGNKLDQFLDVNASVLTRGVQDGTRVTVTVRLHNVAPKNLPPKVTGPYPGAVDGAEGRYQGLLVMQLPGDAKKAAIEGADQLVAAGPDGDTQVVAAYVQLDRDAVVQRTITFVLPARDRELRIEPSARIPGVGWSDAGAQWIDKKPRIVTW